jgi:hypothetical protein
MIKLTLNDQAALEARGARIHQGRASLTVMRVLSGETMERRFVMEGPSGVHTLLVDATDLDRLNAHWKGFCMDRRNQVAA